MQTATNSISPTALHFEAPPLTKQLVVGGNKGRQVRRNRVSSTGPDGQKVATGEPSHRCSRQRVGPNE